MAGHGDFSAGADCGGMTGNLRCFPHKLCFHLFLPVLGADVSTAGEEPRWEVGKVLGGL